MDTDTRLRIGELSSRHGLSTATLRYYERLGLLGEPERTESGYRLFTSDDDDRLRFILRAKALDLTLDEIRSLLDAWHEGKRQETRTNLRHLVAHKIQEVRARAREADAFATQLTHVYDRLGAEHPHPLPSGECGCIPDLPSPTTVALEAELDLIAHSECICGGRLDDTEDCACGCCAPTARAGAPAPTNTIPIELGTRISRGGDDIMTTDTLTITESDSVAATCACCAPAAVQTLAADKDKKEKEEKDKPNRCSCGSGDSEGCGPDCGCGS